jgi:hypothetical protein
MGRWGDIEEAQGPPRFYWGKHCYLTPDSLSMRLKGLLPRSLKTEAGVYRLNDEALDLLEAEVNGYDVDWGGHSVTELLSTAIAKASGWALVFLWHWDEIAEVHEVGPSQAIQLVRNNLIYNSGRKGQVWFGGS